MNQDWDLIYRDLSNSNGHQKPKSLDCSAAKRNALVNGLT